MSQDNFPLVFFKSLADDTRLKILLLLLSEQELCVCEFTSALDLSQPKISRHLALLKQQGIIASRRQGQWVFYSLADSLPDWCLQTLKLCFEQNSNYTSEALSSLTRLAPNCS